MITYVQFVLYAQEDFTIICNLLYHAFNLLPSSITTTKFITVLTTTIIDVSINVCTCIF